MRLTRTTTSGGSRLHGEAPAGAVVATDSVPVDADYDNRVRECEAPVNSEFALSGKADLRATRSCVVVGYRCPSWSEVLRPVPRPGSIKRLCKRTPEKAPSRRLGEYGQKGERRGFCTPALSSLLVLASRSGLVAVRVRQVTIVAARYRRRAGVPCETIARGPRFSTFVERAHNLGWCSCWVLGPIECSRPGYVRRGHARARDRVVPAALPGGVDAHAWCGDGVILIGGKGCIVAEGGRVVVLLAGAAARRCSLSSRNAIRIAHRRDGQHLAVRCGHEVLEVGVTVPRGDCVSDACRYGIADGLVVGVAFARAIGAAAAEAHVGYGKVDTRVSV